MFAVDAVSIGIFLLAGVRDDGVLLWTAADVEHSSINTLVVQDFELAA